MTVGLRLAELDTVLVLAALSALSSCIDSGKSARDVDRFVLALLSTFASFVARKTQDPESYLLQWIALEQELADGDEKAADDGDENRG
jgi:hypothetical protein